MNDLIIFVAGCLVGGIAVNIQQKAKLMSALESLTAALVRATKSVDAAVTALGTPHPTDAQVQAAADAINAQADRLDAAVTPPTE